jgi:hypothetical protein
LTHLIGMFRTFSHDGEFRLCPKSWRSDSNGQTERRQRDHTLEDDQVAADLDGDGTAPVIRLRQPLTL